MVCLPRTRRVISTMSAIMLLFCGGFAGTMPAAWAGSNHQDAQASEQLGIVGVRLSPDGRSLVLNANRPFTGQETRNFSVLRLPAPYRLLVDIPNARVISSQKVFSIQQNGIDRVELTDHYSPFYSAVRAIIYVTDSRTLSHLAPSFENNSLKVDLDEVAMTPASMSAPLATVPFGPARTGIPPIAGSEGGKLRLKPYKPGREVQPLPPFATPVPALSVAKAPPVPPVQFSPSGKNQVSVFGTPVPAGVSLVEDVYYKDNRLYIKGTNGSDLHVKSRFTLTAPSRLVLDIENAVLSSRTQTAPMNGGSDEVQQIRLGQFDDRTVRVVIQSTTPEQFESIYPGSDRSLLALSPYSSTSINKLSANTRLGEVQSIDLKRESGGTVIRLSASSPIVHRFIKRDDRVVLDLLNEASNPATIGVDQRQYPEIEKMRLDPLTDGQPNSKLTIKLAGPGVRVVPTLSDDGRVLELLIADDHTASTSPGNALANLIGLGASGKAPFPARIVVDAGHGGKDMGANRNGVNEKDLNLSLALMLRDALTAKGFKVYMTRSTDVFLPLPQITAITNQIHPDLFISIHHNASVNPSLNGIETYFYTPQSVALARRVQEREINNVAVRDGGVKQARFYVIHHTDVPAILCEVGYVSNPNELNDLQSYDRKAKTARSIADGVVDYLKTRVSARAR
jgi:N-acetylmuramoyl-L-alanine amidase